MFGGSSASDVWNQMFADALGCPVEVTGTPDASALGAAIAAGLGVGVLASPEQAVDAMVRLRRRYEPDAERAAVYDRLYTEVYRDLYAGLHRAMLRLSEIAGFP